MDLLAGLAVGLACAGGAFAQTTLTWNNGAGGDWSLATNWTPNGVPNNNGPNLFNAVISLAGAYTVNLDIDATIENFTHNAAGVVYSLNNTSDLIVNQNMTLGAEFYGRRELGGTGTLRVNGNVTFNNGARLRRTTTALVFGDFTFANSTTDEICDTGIDHRGQFMDWNGNGNIEMGRGASITLSSATTMRINSAAVLGYNGLGATGTVFNSGVIHKLSAGTTFFDRVTLNNAGGGTVRASSGILKFNQVQNYNAGVLTGGRFRSDDAGEIQFVDALDVTLEIQTNNAEVEIIGVNSRFDSINTVETNGAAGILTFADGRNFTTAGNFTNTGTLNVGQAGDASASAFTVASGSTLTNYNAGTRTLTGGTYNLVGGRLAFDGASIGRVAADVTLDGAAASIQTGGGADAFDGALAVDATGKLAVRNKTLTTAGDLTVDGRLVVGAGGTVQTGAGSTITNISGGTLSGGTFEIAGTLRGGVGQTITTVAADVTFDGNAAVIRTAANTDALATWNTIAATGAFTLKGAASYTTQALTDFTVASTGRLSVEAGSEFTVRSGSDLTNFSGGTFASGIFDIKGILRAQNASVTRIENDITLEGGGAQITDLAGNDAFTPLDTVAGTGSLTVTSRSLVVDGSLALDGRLRVRTTPGPRAVGEVTVNGDLHQTGVVELDGGFLTVLGQYSMNGTVRGGGTITSPLSTSVAGAFEDAAASSLVFQGTTRFQNGSSIRLDLVDAMLGAGIGYDQFVFRNAAIFEPGAGVTLRVNDATFAGQVGDVFADVIVFDGTLAGFFTSLDLTIEAQNLTLIPIFNGVRLSLQVVAIPAPGGLVVLIAAGVACGRRRRLA
jgi:hypothetical protein